MSTAWQRISRPSGKEINKLQKPGISQFLGNEREWQARLFALFFFPTPFPGNRLNRLLKVRNLTILSNASIAQQHPSGREHLLSNSEKSLCSFSENKRHVKVISHRRSQERRGASLVVEVNIGSGS